MAYNDKAQGSAPYFFLSLAANLRATVMAGSAHDHRACWRLEHDGETVTASVQLFCVDQSPVL